jgi:hypothetical protein
MEVAAQAMNIQVSNEELTIESLPQAGDAKQIFAFAMSFYSYRQFDSFRAATANARAKPRQTLADLRNELFVSARSSRHVGSDAYIDLYRELLPLIQEAIRQRETAR